MNKSRIIAAYLFVALTFIVLVGRYGYLQISDHHRLLKKSIANYSSVVATRPMRGAILDRNGITLADNQLSYAVAILKRDAGNIEIISTKLSKYINLTEIDKKKYRKQMGLSKNYDWIIIRDDLSNIEIANLTAYGYLFPELNVYAHTKRYYPFGEIYAHAIGYVGRVSPNDREKLVESGKISNYLANDYIGKGGLEAQYEEYLRGEIGKKTIQTDALKNEIQLLDNIPAIDGNTIILTIDNKLQKLSSELLANHTGAVVAIDPNNGGILAFVSNPGYDPNMFLDGIYPEDWDDLNQDPKKPLLNRALQSAYPPGSTFKPFLALAALHLKNRTADWKMYDGGYFVIPGSKHQFRNSGNKVLGTIDLNAAIKYSSDVYFYKLGLDMGIDSIAKTMPMFGFGQKTGIDLPYENRGILPSREWKAKRFGKDNPQRNWQAYDSVNLGVGQGYNTYTPLQMAFATSILANNGVVHKPHLLDKVIDKQGNLVAQYQTTATQLPITKEHITRVKAAMHSVVTGGTAAQISYGLRYTMAGKTGTAQVVGLMQGTRKAKFTGDKYKDHSWFIAFAPVDKPRIAVAVMVENGGWGAGVAGGVARKLFDSYLLADTESAAKIVNSKSQLSGDSVNIESQVVEINGEFDNAND